MATWSIVQAVLLGEVEVMDFVPPKSTPTRVNFSTVEIREYPIIPGINPAVTRGVPLTIDWEPLNKNVYHFEEYEKAVEGVRRKQGEMKMPAKLRTQVLKRLGFSYRHVQECYKAVKKAQKERERTNELLGLRPNDFAIEQFTRAVRNAILPVRYAPRHRNPRSHAVRYAPQHIRLYESNYPAAE